MSLLYRLSSGQERSKDAPTCPLLVPGHLEDTGVPDGEGPRTRGEVGRQVEEAGQVGSAELLQCGVRACYSPPGHG